MQFSVVITTYNRVSTLPRAIESVLTQRGVDFELIVVDDGSTDQTPTFLNQISDPRVTWIRRDNGGLSAARNTGIAQASGDWVTFLDDDDLALPGWLSGFSELIDDRAGMVCCSAEYCDSEGTRYHTAHPIPMGPLFDNVTGLLLAGAFAVRADVLRSIGGYDELLTCSHQTELGLRLVPALLEQGLHTRNTDSVLVRIEYRHPWDRPLSNPAALYAGTRILLDRHHDRIARHAQSRAALNGVLGVSAARLALWSNARSAFFTSARADPLNVRRWMRLVAACFPPVARHVWQVAKYLPGTSEARR